MAEMLGMYSSYEEPRTYIGWYDFGKTSMDYTDFISSVNSPYGFFELWCNPVFGRRQVSYEVGHYPNNTPRILSQANCPYSWRGIQQNLRCFGYGTLGDNDGYKERTFLPQ